MAVEPDYVLGADEAEVARLDAQAASIAAPTSLLLRLGGIAPGMRVLDLGTGLGHVAFQLAELVGPGGSVTGIDRTARLLEEAERRRCAGGIENVRFLEADVRAFRADEPFDAVVGRLILQHLPAPVEALRRWRELLVPGGLVVAVDFDVGTSRAEPPVPVVTAALGWVTAAFRHAGANPVIGARLAPLLRASDYADVDTLGIQPYLAADDARGPALLSAIVRSLAPVILAAGIATEEELGLDSLEARIEEATRAVDAALLLPGVVGAWGRRH